VASQDVSANNFGLLIAYVIPGFTAMKGLPGMTFNQASWGASLADPTIAGFLSASIEAIFAGLTVSTVRWLIIDSLHHRTGVKPSNWDFAVLGKSADAFDLLIQILYRYYKWYANMVIALVWAYLAGGYSFGWKGLLYWLLAGLFFLGSRDALRTYYYRTTSYT
jgi:hypothetical protein